MSFIDVAIPGIIGFVLLLWPQLFVKSRTSPDLGKIRMLRSIGGVLLLVAAVYLVIKLFGA